MMTHLKTTGYRKTIGYHTGVTQMPIVPTISTGFEGVASSSSEWGRLKFDPTEVQVKWPEIFIYPRQNVELSSIKSNVVPKSLSKLTRSYSSNLVKIWQFNAPDDAFVYNDCQNISLFKNFPTACAYSEGTFTAADDVDSECPVTYVDLNRYKCSSVELTKGSVTKGNEKYEKQLRKILEMNSQFVTEFTKYGHHLDTKTFKMDQLTDIFSRLANIEYENLAIEITPDGSLFFDLESGAQIIHFKISFQKEETEQSFFSIYDNKKCVDVGTGAIKDVLNHLMESTDGSSVSQRASSQKLL